MDDENKEINEESFYKIFIVLYSYNTIKKLNDNLITFYALQNNESLNKILDYAQSITIKDNNDICCIFENINLKIKDKVPKLNSFSDSSIIKIMCIYEIILDIFKDQSFIIKNFLPEQIKKNIYCIISKADDQIENNINKINIVFNLIYHFSKKCFQIYQMDNHKKFKTHFLHRTKTHIAELLSYIDDQHYLSKEQIKNRLYFLSSISISLDNFSFHLGKKVFKRARIIDRTKYQNIEAFSYEPFFKKAQDLSYIPDTHISNISQGRLNPEGRALFYAVVDYKSDTVKSTKDKKQSTIDFNVTISEIKARYYDHVCILYSEFKNDIELNKVPSLIYLGIYDHVRRNEKPHFIDNEDFETLTASYNFIKKNVSPETLTAINLIDTFFADIMRRSQSERLYDITSSLYDFLFKKNEIGGVLYTSVHAESQPLVALTPRFVDEWLIYKSAEVIEIEDVFSYGFYKTRQLDITDEIDSDGNLFWRSTSNIADSALSSTIDIREKTI